MLLHNCKRAWDFHYYSSEDENERCFASDLAEAA